MKRVALPCAQLWRVTICRVGARGRAVDRVAGALSEGGLNPSLWTLLRAEKAPLLELARRVT